METQVRTPQSVFMLPQRFLVPLFQRPYVWTEETQWEPLWEDVTRVAERVLREPQARHHPHFLGAVVLQQVPNVVGQLQTRTVIDGQQRLTTLQLLLDALHAELIAVEGHTPAARLQPLIENGAAFCMRPEDRFKVWPTNRDRPAFNAVMGAPPPVNHDAVGFKGEKMVEAHRYFSEAARTWLRGGDAGQSEQRGAAIELAVRDLLQMVVIDLNAEENAQEIFETLNARGAQLTAADLIKNFIFQRLSETDADVEGAYETFWREFETAFWETQISVGRLFQQRSSVFLNHWLIARTGEDIPAREVFDRFKRFVNEQTVGIVALLGQIHRAAQLYRQLAQTSKAGPLTRLDLFVYRTGVMESEIVKPLLLCLLDPEEPAIPDQQLTLALNAIESWMVRRMLVRVTTKGHNKILGELIGKLRRSPREKAGETVVDFFRSQAGESAYWPDDDELRAELRVLPAYNRLSRGRLRMVLEALEDHLRGWKDGKDGLGGERVARGQFAIEHIMPRRWHTHWEPTPGVTELERDRRIHVLGNLTLLTKALNGKVSNGPWNGGKRVALKDHCVLFLNRQLLEQADSAWSETGIDARTEALAGLALQIWPTPDGHRAIRDARPLRRRKHIALVDLLNAGVLEPTMRLIPLRKAYQGRTVTLLSDGQLDVDGRCYAQPSEAATAIVGKRTNGWGFFLVDEASRRSLRQVRTEYFNSVVGQLDEEDDDGEEGEDG